MVLVTPEYVLYLHGLMRWSEHSVRINYEHIKEIEINQTMLQKFFDTGDVILLSVASHLVDDVRMCGVRNPHQVKDLIRARTKSPMQEAWVVNLD